MKRWKGRGGEVFARLTEYKYQSQVEKSPVEHLTVCRIIIYIYARPPETSKPIFANRRVYLKILRIVTQASSVSSYVLLQNLHRYIVRKIEKKKKKSI